MSQNIEIERRLAAVLAADVAGFSRLTEADEVGTLRVLAAQRAILDNAISRHRGRIANTAGDSVLAEFPSAVNAVQCAVEAQAALRDAAESAPADRRVLFRIGIHVGDVMVRGGDLLGNGVNVAARLESLADAGGIVLSAATHEQVKKVLPLAYTDLGPQSVKNIEEPVRAFAIGAAPARIMATVSEGGASLPLPEKPSIAVLPFQNMSGDPEQEYFADGIVEDIITALSRFKSLFVIARNSTFTYKGKSIDIKRVGRELGVRYVLEGSVRKAGERVRITGQLIEAATNKHLWADKYDGSLEDIFEIQDQVTAQVCGRIVPTVEQAEIERRRAKATDSLAAYDYYLRGLVGHDSWTREGNAEALAMFSKAMELDPSFTAAMVRVCSCYTQRQQQGWMASPELEATTAVALAKRAINLERGDAYVLAWASFCIASFTDDIEGSCALSDDAVKLNPGLHVANLLSAVQHVWCGYPQIGVARYQTALRLNPVDPLNFAAMTGLASAYFHMESIEHAIEWLEKALARNFGYPPLLRLGAAIHATAGNTERAHQITQRLFQLDPEYRISKTRLFGKLRRPEDRKRLDTGLRLAGLPA